MLVDRVADLHGSFSPTTAHVYHGGPKDPNFSLMDK